MSLEPQKAATGTEMPRRPWSTSRAASSSAERVLPTRRHSPLARPVLVVTLCLAGLMGAGTLHAEDPPHFATANTLLNQILACQDAGILVDEQGVFLNRYGGSWSSKTNPSFYRLGNEEQGILPANNTKCSSLVTHLLKNVYNWNWKNYSFVDPISLSIKSTASPEAYQYVALIKQQQGFVEIPLLADALPGDVLSWWEVGKSSGDHTMLIAHVDWDNAKPYPLGYANSNPALAGTTYVPVTVIDSSSDTHTDDSRFVDVNGVETHIAGIGTGVIGLLINDQGVIIGRTWSLPTSDYETQTNTWVGSLNNRLKLAPIWEFAIGRVPPLP
ncbi:MAG: hypothetical protein U1A77_20895 [Pirellulales bacterium]